MTKLKRYLQMLILGCSMVICMFIVVSRKTEIIKGIRLKVENPGGALLTKATEEACAAVCCVTPNPHSGKRTANDNVPFNNTDRTSVHRADQYHSGTPAAVRYHIGVLSSAKYLQTRAPDVFHTWGKEAHSLSFYIGEVHTTSTLPFTKLPDVNDTAYPPQQKSFEMLRHWCNNYIDEYDWFIKSDDDAYIKIALLEKFLVGLDSNVKYYIGKASIGFAFERKALSLYGNEYCGGQTVIYSKPLLKALCPHIDSCLSHIATSHEDTEIGRCVIFKTGLQCHGGTKSSELFVTTKGKMYGTDLRLDKSLETVFSLHEVKHSVNMYNLHFQYKLGQEKIKLTNSTPQKNPYGVQSSKAKLTKDICKKENCTFSPRT